MLHRMYNFDFSHKPNIVDRDCYFIPSGYDSLSVLRGFDITQDLDKLYEERIPKMKVKGQLRDDEIYCEDLQVFLGKWRSGKRTIQASSSNEINDHSEKTLDKNYISPSKESLHKKSGTNSSTDFSIFLNSSGSKKGEELLMSDKKNLEIIKKNEASRLLKEGDDKGGKSRDLMKKINALKNRKTGGQDK